MCLVRPFEERTSFQRPKWWLFCWWVLSYRWYSFKDSLGIWNPKVALKWSWKWATCAYVLYFLYWVLCCRISLAQKAPWRHNSRTFGWKGSGFLKFVSLKTRIFRLRSEKPGFGGGFGKTCHQKNAKVCEGPQPKCLNRRGGSFEGCSKDS